MTIRSTSIRSTIQKIDDIGDVVITTPTNKDLLTYDSSSGNWINSPAVIQGMEFVRSVTLGANATVFDTGADLTGDYFYRIVAQIKTGATSSTWQFHTNGDDTDAHYFSQYLLAAGVVVTGANANQPAFFQFLSGYTSKFIFDAYKDIDGFIHVDLNFSNPHAGQVLKACQVCESGTSVFQKLEIKTSTANNLLAGSRYDIYRMKRS